MFISISDLRYTFRQIAKNPGFALLAILVLAGGLSLSIFAFTTTYTMAYKTLDLPNGKKIVEVCTKGPLGACMPFKAYEFASMRQEISTLELVGAYKEVYDNVEYEDAFFDAAITQTEWSMFALSDATPLFGRTLLDSDQDPNAEPVAVIAHDFWQLALNGDENIIGKTVNMGGEPVRVVGVMPAGFKYPRWTDAWIPLPKDLLSPILNDLTLVDVYARLKSGVSKSKASEDIDRLMQRVRAQNPPRPTDDFDGTYRLINEANSGLVMSLPYKGMSGIGNQLTLLTINVMAGIIFLLACINIGTLLLARTNERLKDMSIRVALGAPRGRLLVQSMSESIVIAIVGAILAVLFAGIALEGLNLFLLTLLSGGELQFWMDFEVDGSTIVAAFAFALATVVITSAIPSWKLINGNFNSVMQDGSRGAVGLRAGRFSKSLVVVAITLITMFLYVGTITTATMWSMGRTYKMIDPEGLSSVEINTNEQLSNSQQRFNYYQEVQRRLSNLAGVSEVMMIGVLGSRTVEVDGELYLTDEDRPSSPVQVLSGNLASIGANLLAGRYLDSSESFAGERSALVSRSLAQRLWPDISPIGMSLKIKTSENSEQMQAFRVVGMTSDTPMDGQERFKQELDMIYIPLGQLDSENITAIVRSTANPDTAVQQLQKEISQLNSGVQLNAVSWVKERQAIAFVVRITIGILSVCGVFAFLVSIAGIFGLTKNSVILRTQEIGTRRALGAKDSVIMKAFVIVAVKQVLWGFFFAFLITAPFSIILYFTMGAHLLLSGISVTLVVLAVLFCSVLFAIHHPISRILLKEPSDLLRHQ